MPCMPRFAGKATKIAYKILGKPANMQDIKTPYDREVNRRLIFEETVKVR